MSKLQDTRKIVQKYGQEYGWEWSKETGLINRASTYGQSFLDQWNIIDDAKEGLIWLKSGQYQTCGVSVAIDDTTTISDWSRTIALDDVYVSVQTNENGYPTLVISSHPIEE